MKKTVIILGSARSKGHTYSLCRVLSQTHTIKIIDLKQKNIGHFDYEFKNQEDDFIALIRQIIDDYDQIIFASPVYWYSMSGRMKVFFDRISDLLINEKELGRKLRGKEMAVISCSSDAGINAGFYMPFRESAAYLGMTYIGDVHGWVADSGMPDEVKERLVNFGKKLEIDGLG